MLKIGGKALSRKDIYQYFGSLQQMQIANEKYTIF